MDPPRRRRAAPTRSARAVRRLFRAGTLPLRRGLAAAEIDDLRIPGPSGPLAGRRYVPPDPQPVPLVVYFHGGGFTVGDLYTHDHVCRAIAAASGAVVVAVDYRLAPEHPFPAAPDDALATARWALRYRSELGAGAEGIVLAGDSAGGNLAAVTSVSLRGESGLAGQVLVYPVVDARADDDQLAKAASWRSGLPPRLLQWFADAYEVDEALAEHPRLSPLLAPAHADLPPALVVVAEHDPLRDQGVAYVETLRAAGVDATLVERRGVGHGFLSVPGGRRHREETIAAVGRWIAGLASS